MEWGRPFIYISCGVRSSGLSHFWGYTLVPFCLRKFDFSKPAAPLQPATARGFTLGLSLVGS